MQHLFVEYELAKKLQQAGFAEPCFSWFIDETRLIDHGFYGSDMEGYKGEVLRCPIYQQVFDWLEGKSLLMHPAYFSEGKYGMCIYELPNLKIVWPKFAFSQDEMYATKKQAWDLAIEEALRLLKHKT